MAKKKARKKTRRRTAGRRKTDQRQPGWLYLCAGLAIGLSVAAYVYLNDLPSPDELAAGARQQAKVAITTVKKAEQQAQDSVANTLEQGKAEAEEFDFDFYDMLPNLDVAVYDDPETPTTARAVRPQAPVTAPGIYILQAGSFSSVADANRRKAEMGLLGIRSDIKRGRAGNRTVYRVYTEPMDQPAEVNRVSKLLTDANIEVLRKRVTD